MLKELNKAFTQKTQKLAEQTKRFGRFEQHADILERYAADPAATIRELADQHGLTLAEPSADAQTAEATADAAQPAVDAIVESFKQKLGPELEYLADSLAPAITELVRTLTHSTVETATAPLKAAEEARRHEQAVAETQVVMQTFEKAHPDWKQHEPAMLALAQQLQPNGMSELEYLELLHRAVTFKTQVAEAAKQKVAAVTAAAKKAEPRADATSDSKVRRSSPKHASFQDAFEAAKRGERWDDD